MPQLQVNSHRPYCVGCIVAGGISCCAEASGSDSDELISTLPTPFICQAPTLVHYTLNDKYTQTVFFKP